MHTPEDMVGRQAEWARLAQFAGSGLDTASLGIVWGRRRVGKSFLLESLARQANAFYYEAVRGSSGEALRELGERIGAHMAAAAPLALDDWEAAVTALLALGRDRETVVVLDEYPYLTEHTPGLDTIVQRVLGARHPARTSSRARLILCGSAITVMGRILAGSAALRGRAGMDLLVSPFDLRTARELHGIEDLETAFRTYAVIGGVAAYAREMVDGDLPGGPTDFDRWVCRRVLSPAAPLFHEVGLLLSEDPATSRARKLNLYHAVLAGVAMGHHAHSHLTRYVKLPGASLAPIVDALVGAELIERCADPIRDNRPTYHPADPLLRFHYAVIRRHATRLARPAADTRQVWNEVRPTFEAQVVGPAFEAAARTWTARDADDEMVGGRPDHVGATTVGLADGTEMEIDVVAAADDAAAPAQRRVLCLGEAKAGERLSQSHLRRLEAARTALGARAADARLLLFGPGFTPGLAAAAARRGDVTLIGLQRLYA